MTLRSPASPCRSVPSIRVPDALIGIPVSNGVPPPLVARKRPIASNSSSAKPSGSMVLWQLAQTGLLRCCSSRSRTERGVPPSFALGRLGTLGGAGEGGVPRTFSSSQTPRTTGDVRLAYDVIVRRLACPSSPPRVASGYSTRRKCTPCTSGMP